MCVLANLLLCRDGRPTAHADEDEEYFRYLMAQARPEPQHPPLPQRKLTHVRTQRRPRHVRLYEMHGREPEQRQYNCVLTKTIPSFHICVHPVHIDKYISSALVSDGIWEPYITPILQRALYKYPDASLIDVGANIGYYTLLAARMGRHVIAVEPALENVVRLHKGALLSRVTRTVDVVYSAVSDRHENVTVVRNVDNQGGLWVEPLTVGGRGAGGGGPGMEVGKGPPPEVVMTTTLDHLLEVADFSQAVIKIDIEGYECKAMAGARRLLTKVYVPYIFMEWKKMYQALHRDDSPCPLAAVAELTETLVARGYVPYEVRTGFQMNPERSTIRWRIGDIYWRRKDAKALQDPY